MRGVRHRWGDREIAVGLHACVHACMCTLCTARCNGTLELVTATKLTGRKAESDMWYRGVIGMRRNAGVVGTSGLTLLPWLACQVRTPSAGQSAGCPIRRQGQSGLRGAGPPGAGCNPGCMFTSTSENACSRPTHCTPLSSLFLSFSALWHSRSLSHFSPLSVGPGLHILATPLLGLQAHWQSVRHIARMAPSCCTNVKFSDDLRHRVTVFINHPVNNTVNKSVRRREITPEPLCHTPILHSSAMQYAQLHDRRRAVQLRNSPERPNP